MGLPSTPHLPTYRCVQQNHRLRRLCSSLDKSSPVNINLTLTIYKSLIRSTLTYAAPAWGQAANTHFNILQNFQNKLLRMITKFQRVTPIDTLYERTGMDSVKKKGKGRLWVLQHCCLEAYCTLTRMSSFIHLQRRCTHQAA